MSRAARLLDLLQALRRRRRPVVASDLASELGVSIRTIYRDVATLASQGAPIEGEPGLGYVLRPGFFLPPLQFGPDELDAVILGLRFVEGRGDAALAEAAIDALAKIIAVLPPEAETEAAASGLATGPSRRKAPSEADQILAVIRAAMRDERKVHLDYLDKKGRATTRTVWPVLVGFFEATEVLAAWCELREGFRHFRLDRIAGAVVNDERLPRRRRILLADWRLAEEIDDY